MANIHLNPQDVQLLRQHSDLFPSDPFLSHSPPVGRHSDEVTSEKRDIHLAMCDEADEFSGSSRNLIELTADLAILFHHNQFRKGGGDPIYSSHVAEVGRRSGAATDSIDTAFPEIRDALGEILAPKAVAIALGRLHDAIEDFGANFKREMVSNEDAKKVAEAKMRIELTQIIGPSAAAEIVKRVIGLSLTNDEEFPDREYVTRIVGDPYMRLCKGADYDHNLETFPGFTETYPLFIVPAQYGAIIEGTLFEERYARKLLNCLNSYDRNEIVPWNQALRAAGVKTSDLIKDLFDKYNEPEALDRLSAYYQVLDERLEAGDLDEYIAKQGMEKDHLRQRIQELLGELEPNLPPYLRVTPTEEGDANTPAVSSNFVGNIPVQLLGPMRMWGGEIHVDGMSLVDAKALVENTGKQLGCRFPGYFYEGDDGTIIYHISRYPRKAGLEVPPLEEFRRTLKGLFDAFQAKDAKVEMREEQVEAMSTIRVVLGLKEGYFDQRKVDIERKIEDGTFSDMNEIRSAIADRLGDLTEHGIDVDAFDSPQILREALKQISLSVLHNVSEVSVLLGASGRVRPAEIYSVAPDYIYSEEAVLIEVPADRQHFEKLVRIADSMKQARFTTERLDIGSVVNVEIKAFSQGRSAKMI